MESPLQVNSTAQSQRHRLRCTNRVVHACRRRIPHNPQVSVQLFLPAQLLARRLRSGQNQTCHQNFEKWVLPADSKGYPVIKPVQPKAAKLAAAQSTEGHGFGQWSGSPSTAGVKPARGHRGGKTGGKLVSTHLPVDKGTYTPARELGSNGHAGQGKAVTAVRTSST